MLEYPSARIFDWQREFIWIAHQFLVDFFEL